MRWARMYQHSAPYPHGDWRNYPVPALGSDAVLYLDGRFSYANRVTQAKEYARMMNDRLGKGYIGVRLESGPSLLDAQPDGPVEFL